LLKAAGYVTTRNVRWTGSLKKEGPARFLPNRTTRSGALARWSFTRTPDQSPQMTSFALVALVHGANGRHPEGRRARSRARRNHPVRSGRLGHDAVVLCPRAVNACQPKLSGIPRAARLNQAATSGVRISSMVANDWRIPWQGFSRFETWRGRICSHFALGLLPCECLRACTTWLATLWQMVQRLVSESKSHIRPLAKPVIVATSGGTVLKL